MSDPRHEVWMARALALAAEAAAKGEAPVGALVVDEATGAVVAEAHNEPITLNDPTGHAEILALRRAAAARGNYRLTGLTLVVTLEPCAMCAGAISHARIARLIWGADDEKGGAVAHGPRFFDQPTCHWRPELVRGVMKQAAGEILRSFFRARRKGRLQAQRTDPT